MAGTYGFDGGILAAIELEGGGRKWKGGRYGRGQLLLPTMNAYEAAQNSGRFQELPRQLVDLAISRNQSGGSGTDIPATFMRVTASV